MINLLITIFIIGFLFLIFKHAYYATQTLWFYILVLHDIRKSLPDNNLNFIWEYPYLMVRQWFSVFLFGNRKIEGEYVEAKSDNTRYYFRGWKYPEIIRGSEKSNTK